MSSRAAYKQLQHGHNKQFNLYEQLQDAVYQEVGITCSIKVKPECVSVRTRDYTDFVLARSIISKRTGLPVVRDAQVFGEKEASEQTKQHDRSSVI